MSGEWTDPKETCPLCGAHLLVETFDGVSPQHDPVRYCSLVGCERSDHPRDLRRVVSERRPDEH